ncbi:MAG: saccharopine dehydrogenase NADP-binding domain-containing protein [Gemmatimonadota bacterium]|nr:saccharopine dehydrogenase NADP-binding domain-containing protein [Gemmatimonadota bacterium]
MRMLILGAGLQGSACAWDLLRTTDTDVTLADQNPDALPGFLKAEKSKRLSLVKFDARDLDAAAKLLGDQHAVMSALPYYFNGTMARLALEHGVHFSDLGGNTEIVREQQQLDARAREKKISIMPDCGLAPGMVNILAAEGIRRLDSVDAVRLYVGGLPQAPKPPLNYNIVYSLEGVLDYYTTPSWVLRDGTPVMVEALSEIESVEFPDPVGRLEAFHTAGGISTMPWDFSERIPTMEYKTLRYPGHADIMRAIRELGLLDLDPIAVDGTTVRPRDVFVALVNPKLRRPDVEDLVALKVMVEGTKGGAPKTVTFELVDYFDGEHGISAMERTTGYSLSITGQMQAGGRVDRFGVTTAWEGMPFEPYVKALAKRGIRIQERS